MIPEISGDLVQWLRGFYYTVQTGSMSAAASIMNRNQSSLSHQIKSLEEELGVKLFIGTKGKRTLTAEGKFLLEKTISIFEIINTVRATIGTIPEELEGEISIVGMFTVIQYYLPSFLASFTVQHPNVRFQLYGEARRDNVLELVSSRKYDLGMLSIENIPPEFHATRLFSTNVMLVTPKSGPYALTGSPSLEQVSRFPRVYAPLGSTMHPFIERQFARHGMHMKDQYMVSHFEAAKEYVKMGLGITFLDEFACTEEDRHTMNVLPMSNYFPPRVFSVIRRRDLFNPPHLEAFMRMLTQPRSEKMSELPTAE